MDHMRQTPCQASASFVNSECKVFSRHMLKVEQVQIVPKCSEWSKCKLCRSAESRASANHALVLRPKAEVMVRLKQVRASVQRLMLCVLCMPDPNLAPWKEGDSNVQGAGYLKF
eukprot:1136939-Pelagomonas_calceolata.AAC.1